jgi:nicotinamidase-related amidase
MSVRLAPTLPEPGFYEPQQARDFAYSPRLPEIATQAAAFRGEHGVAPAAADPRRVELLAIDMQKDFSFPEGALYVGGRSGSGALDDNDRLARFIYRNLARLSAITCTLDTHHPFQIFFPAFWMRRDGTAPEPHVQVAADDVRKGVLRPNPEVAGWLSGGDEKWLTHQVTFYCEQLESDGKYRLYLWPPHCLLGTEGHTLTGVIQAAHLFHSVARQTRDPIELKGEHPLTENYSALSPEVVERHDGGTLATRNTPLVDRLLAADLLIVAGEASSHCVRSTLEDLLTEIERRDRALAGRVYVLRDCMSPVAVPDPERPGSFLADFTPQADEMLGRCAAAGMHLVDSTRDMADWPGM